MEASSSETGLTFPQTLALWLLHFEDGLLVSELANRGLWHVSTALGIVTRLEAKGLVRLEEVEKGRGRRVYLTEQGRKSRQLTTQYPSNLFAVIQSMDSEEFSAILSRGYNLAEKLVGTDYVKWLQRTADKYR